MKYQKVKKIFTLLIIAFGLAIIPVDKSSALSGSLSCAPTSINPGATSTCTLSANATEGGISGGEAKISVSGSLTLGAVGTTGWTNIGSEGDISLLPNSVAKFDSSVVLATFSVTAGSTAGQSGTVTVSGILLNDASLAEVPVTDKTAAISIVAPATQTPAATQTPVTQTPATQTPATQTPAKKATPPTAPTSNDTSKSGNTYLSSISLSDSSIDFYKDTTEYSFTVPYSVTNIEVMTVLEDEKSSVTVGGNTDLAVGENTITILVTAENGATRTYTLIATRENDNKLAKTMKEEPKSNPAALFAVIALPLVGLIAIIIAVIMIIKRKKNKLIIPDSNPVPGQPESFGSGGLTEPAETYSDSTTNSIPPSIDEYTPYEQPTIDQPMEATPTEYTVPAEATPTTTPPIDAQPVDEVMPQNNYFK